MADLGGDLGRPLGPQESGADARTGGCQRLPTGTELLQRTSPRNALSSTNFQYAFAVSAKPGGTSMPAPRSRRVISPSDAFLPPTRARSLRPTSPNPVTNVSDSSRIGVSASPG
jgi:hypothetical protein